MGEAVASSTSTSATNVLGPALMQLIAYPSPVTTLDATSGVGRSTITLQWTSPGLDGDVGSLASGTTFFVRIASYTAPDTFSFPYANVSISTSGNQPGLAVSTPIYNLWSNTTYYTQLWTTDPGGGVSFQSNRSTQSTLAPPPSPIVSADQRNIFLNVYYSSVTVAWYALPTNFGSSNTAEGYVLEASSTNFGALGPGGTTSSTQTWHVSDSTLTVLNPALVSGKLYYFRVGSLNWSGQPNYTIIGSTQTLLQASVPSAVSPPFIDVSSYSATPQWGRNGNPTQAVYTLQASVDPGYLVNPYSSTTYNLSFGLFTLAPNTTYYFRVNATTASSVSAYLDLGSTATLASPPLATAGSIASVFQSSMTLSWLPNGNGPSVSTYVVTLTSGTSMPNGYAGNIAFSTMPAGGSPVATPSGLMPNTTYNVFVDAQNWESIPSQYASLGTTVTLSAPPVAAAAPFPEIDYSSMTLSWGGNGNPVSQTTYTIVLTTGSFYPNSFTGNLTMSTAPAGASLAATIAGLAADTTYYAFAESVNFAGVASAYALLGSTSTRAAPPAASPDVSTFTAVTAAGFTLNWSSGAAGTAVDGPATYYAEVSPDPGFASAVASSQTANLDAIFSALSTNTTYYARVAAYSNYLGTWTAFTSFGSTATLAAVPAAAASTFPSVWLTSMTVEWLPNGNPVGVTSYTVVWTPQSSYPNADPSNVVVSTAPSGAAPAATGTGLAANTTFYVFVAATNYDGMQTAYASLGSSSTLASLPASPAVGAVYPSSITVAWTAVGSEGYELRASSTNFGALLAGGAVALSSTTDGSATSLTVSGLDSNTTYYFRLGSYNWDGAVDSVLLSSQASLAPTVSGASIVSGGVYDTSATVNWTALPAAPPQSASGEGYELDAATADVNGVSDFGGTIFSSITYARAATSLVVQGLDPGTTYAFRLGSLTWDGTPDYVIVGATKTRVTPFTWTGAAGDGNWYTKGNWNPVGIPGPGSPVTIGITAAVGVAASSPSISFSSITIGNPAGTAVASLTIATTIANGGDVLIYHGAGLTQATASQLYFNGTFTMVSGSSLTHVAQGVAVSSVNISVAETFDLQAGATVTVVGLGYGGGAARGTGSGPGGGGAGSTNGSGGGGGGHGGAGGAGSVGAGGSVNDTNTNPILAGSGGGGGRSLVGAAGGGVVRIQASSMAVNGEILTDGAAATAGTGAGGGGAGGAVQLTATYFSGAGVISSTGGAGGATVGGGGGGGIVSIAITGSGNTCSLSFDVSGGTGSTNGSLGVISTTATLAVPSLAAVNITSASIQWDWTSVSGGVSYQVFSSTGGSGQSPVLGAGTTYFTESGLSANTTYTRYVQVSACGTTNVSSSLAYATLSSTVAALAQSGTAVGTSFVTAAWAALPGSPGPATSEGYQVEASTRADFLAPIQSSATPNVAASTLTITGLSPNTTYYLRVASLNWAGTLSPYTALGSTPTLATAPSAAALTFSYVADSTATVNWTGLPLSPPEASSKTCEGYEVDASSTNFGALSPGGLIVSSMTTNPALTALTLQALDLSTTQYFRVGSVNYAGVVNYTSLSSLNVEVDPPLASVSLGTLDASLFTSTVSVQSVLVRNLGNIPLTFVLSASTATGSTPWSLDVSTGVDVATLQAVWNSVAPGPGSFSVAVTSSDRVSGGAGGNYAGDESGQTVPAGQARSLWFLFWRPTATSSTAAQSIQVRVKAQYP